MKRTMSVIFLAMLVAFTASSKDITGKWYGLLNGVRIVFNISKTDNGEYHSTIASPDQEDKASPITTTTFKDSKLVLDIPKASIGYRGIVKGTSIDGVFIQSGIKYKMNLSRTPIKKIQNKFEPKKPYPIL